MRRTGHGEKASVVGSITTMHRCGPPGSPPRRSGTRDRGSGRCQPWNGRQILQHALGAPCGIHFERSCASGGSQLEVEGSLDAIPPDQVVGRKRLGSEPLYEVCQRSYSATDTGCT